MNSKNSNLYFTSCKRGVVGDLVLPEHLVPLLYCFADTRGKESRKVIIVLLVTVTKMMPMTMRTRILNREHRIHNDKD